MDKDYVNACNSILQWCGLTLCCAAPSIVQTSTGYHHVISMLHSFHSIIQYTALNVSKDQGISDEVRDACSGALFVINDLDQQSDNSEGSSTSSAESENHIMISYQ